MTRHQVQLTTAGFSVVELLVVITLIFVLTAIGLFALMPHRSAYRTDDETLRILDFLRDASQRALTQRQTMRLEIDLTSSTIRLIDENGAGTSDDQIVRQESLLSLSEVRIDAPPPGFSPPNPPNYPPAVYTTSNHPLSSGHRVWIARFRSDGSVVDASINPSPTSATLFLWPPRPDDINVLQNPQAVRAITLFGGTGAVRVWKYDGTKFVAR